MKVLFVLVFLSCSMLLCATALADDHYLDEVARHYEFDQWPGKAYPLLNGVDMTAFEPAGLKLVSTEHRQHLGAGTLYRYRLPDSVSEVPPEERDADLGVEVRVHDTVADAKRALLIFLGSLTRRLPRGEAAGVRIGEICFVAPGSGEPTRIAFLRRNVTALLRSYRHPRPPVSLVKLAEMLDRHMQGGKKVSEAGRLNRPEISRFELEAARVLPGAAAPLAIKVTGQAGGKPQILWKVEGAVVLRQNGKFRFLAEKPGVYRIEICAVGPRLLCSRRALEIRVHPE
jgi:hypothetical protein